VQKEVEHGVEAIYFVARDGETVECDGEGIHKTGAGGIDLVRQRCAAGIFVDLIE